MAVAAVVTLCVCQRTTPPVERTPVAQSRPLDAAKEPLVLVPAARCGECHGNMEREWRSSAHAQSDASPIYRAMRAASGGKHCDRCHAPLRALAVGDPVAAEGVTCDVCHTIASVQVDRAPDSFLIPRTTCATDLSVTPPRTTFIAWAARCFIASRPSVRLATTGAFALRRAQSFRSCRNTQSGGTQSRR